MKRALLLLAGIFLLNVTAFSQNTNFWIFLCFGQSNMEGYPGIQDEDKGPVDDRFQMFAAVDFPKQEPKTHKKKKPLARFESAAQHQSGRVECCRGGMRGGGGRRGRGAGPGC